MLSTRTEVGASAVTVSVLCSMRTTMRLSRKQTRNSSTVRGWEMRIDRQGVNSCAQAGTAPRERLSHTAHRPHMQTGEAESDSCPANPSGYASSLGSIGCPQAHT